MGGEPYTWRRVSTVRRQAVGNLPPKGGTAPTAEPTGYGHESGRGHETVEVHRFRKQDRPLRGGFHRQEKAENKITGCMKWKTEKLPG